MITSDDYSDFHVLGPVSTSNKGVVGRWMGECEKSEALPTPPTHTAHSCVVPTAKAHIGHQHE